MNVIDYNCYRLHYKRFFYYCQCLELPHQKSIPNCIDASYKNLNEIILIIEQSLVYFENKFILCRVYLSVNY